jgi:DNA repair protein SbcD/Mre11
MRLLHTADWHLGHHLHGYDRSYEHERFLDWLTSLIQERHIDGLLIAGDIFDTANPSAASWQLFYRFLARLRTLVPHLNVVAIGGNHDSPSKLDAPHELLKAFELHLVGAVSRDGQGALELDRLIVPLKDSAGAIQAWCAAVPYLRSADLRLDEVNAEGVTDPAATEDRLVAGVRAIYRQVLNAIEARRSPEQPILALGHAYLSRGELSQLSERKVLGGNQHALPLDIFQGADYVALGHLHLAQSLAPQVHYSGSPLPLSLAEAAYNHQVLELELGAEGVTLSQRHPVPRIVPMLRLPAEPLPLAEVEQQLQALTLEACPAEQRPFLEVRVRLEKPEPRLRERILAAIAGRPVRLARIVTHYDGDGESMADRLGRQQLDELSPEQVFTLCYQRHYAQPPEPGLQAAFSELLSAHQELSS